MRRDARSRTPGAAELAQVAEKYKRSKQKATHPVAPCLGFCECKGDWSTHRQPSLSVVLPASLDAAHFPRDCAACASGCPVLAEPPGVSHLNVMRCFYAC